MTTPTSGAETVKQSSAAQDQGPPDLMRNLRDSLLRAKIAAEIRAQIVAGARMPDDLTPKVGRPTTGTIAEWAARIAEGRTE